MDRRVEITGPTDRKMVNIIPAADNLSCSRTAAVIGVGKEFDVLSALLHFVQTWTSVVLRPSQETKCASLLVTDVRL
jgi:hypothetical protein